jgi:hypothetical protein
MRTKIALVTGATSGIGAEFTRLLAKEKYNLVLVARDEPRLRLCAEALAREFNIECEVIRADLSTVEGSNLVEQRISDSDNPIDVLINNAGFGNKESFLVTSVESEQALFDVLARVPMRLMHAVLPIMKSRNEGIIINVSSVSCWIAGGAYSAAKSYMTVLSESLHSELRGTNVKVSALTPGFTHTEFHQRGKMRMDKLPNFLWLNVNDVVQKGWDDARAGKALSVPGRQYQILSFIARYGPRPFIRKYGISIRKKQR